MATLRDVKRRAKELGATVRVERSKAWNGLHVEAPHGKVWSCSVIHELVEGTYPPWRPDYEDTLARMNYGIEDCPDGDKCEWCNPEE